MGSVLRVKLAVVDIKIGSAVMNIKTLVDSELVPWCGLAGCWDVILNCAKLLVVISRKQLLSSLPLVQSAVT